MEIEKIKSDRFSIELQKEISIVHQFSIEINGDKLNLNDFNLISTELHSNTDRIKDFIIRNLKDVSKDSKFEDFL